MWLFRIYTQLEVSMNDVERVEEYTHELPTEDYDATDASAAAAAAAAPPATAAWPSEGAIEFCGVRLQYASATRPIFDGLSFAVAPRTRVGVVGRTGAGKSSLTVALFRVVELAAGRILLDGVDARGLSLTRLRSSLSIIQQEPPPRPTSPDLARPRPTSPDLARPPPNA